MINGTGAAAATLPPSADPSDGSGAIAGPAPEAALRRATFELSDARVDRSVQALGGQLDRSLAVLSDAGAAEVAEAVVAGTSTRLPAPDGSDAWFDRAGAVAETLQRGVAAEPPALAAERAAVGREIERLVVDGKALAAADPGRTLEIQQRIDAAVDGVERTVGESVAYRFAAGFDPMRASMESFGLTSWAALPPLTRPERREAGQVHPEFPHAVRAWR